MENFFSMPLAMTLLLYMAFWEAFSGIEMRLYLVFVTQ